MAAPCAVPWTEENTWDWVDKTLTSTHDLSVWSSSSLGRWHPRSSVPLVLTRHSLLILNERWTHVINLSMFFLLCYGLTTILRSQALHWVLSLAIQYAWCSYMLCRLYGKIKTFRSDLPTFLYVYMFILDKMYLCMIVLIDYSKVCTYCSTVVKNQSVRLAPVSLRSPYVLKMAKISARSSKSQTFNAPYGLSESFWLSGSSGLVA
jgi:hypothetical protein